MVKSVKSKTKVPFKAKMKEFFRRRMVSLKRNPATIPLVFVLICMLIATFTMTNYSHTIDILDEKPMGLLYFIITLCSILSLVSYVQAYPKRAKTKKYLVYITLLLLAIAFVCEIFYIDRVIYATTTRTFPAPIANDSTKPYIQASLNTSYAHLVFLGISMVLICLVPLMKKWFSHIDTSVELEDEANVQEIEVAADKE